MCIRDRAEVLARVEALVLADVLALVEALVLAEVLALVDALVLADVLALVDVYKRQTYESDRNSFQRTCHV